MEALSPATVDASPSCLATSLGRTCINDATMNSGCIESSELLVMKPNFGVSGLQLLLEICELVSSSKLKRMPMRYRMLALREHKFKYISRENHSHDLQNERVGVLLDSIELFQWYN